MAHREAVKPTEASLRHETEKIGGTLGRKLYQNWGLNEISLDFHVFFLRKFTGIFFTCESNGDEMGFSLWELNMARSKSTNEMEVYSWKNHLPLVN